MSNRILIGMLALSSLSAWSQPMNFTATLDSIKIYGQPGQAVNRTFQLTLSPDYKPTQFKSHVGDFWKSEDGHQSVYAPAGTLGRSCGKWVTLNPLEKRIQPGEKLETRLTVAIPSATQPGGYWCVLNVDQIPDPLEVVPGDSVRLNFLASISVGIYVYIEPVKRAATVAKVEVLPNEARLKLVNDGNAPLGVEGRFEFVPAGNAAQPVKVLIPRQTIYTEPERSSLVITRLPPPETLPSGEYVVRVILDIGLDHLIGVQKRMEIQR